MHQLSFSFFVFYFLEFNIINANEIKITLPPITCYTNGLENIKVNPEHSYKIVYNGGKIAKSCALVGFFGFADDKDFRDYTYQQCVSMEVFDIDCGSTDVSLQYRIRTGQSVVRHLKLSACRHLE
ncbi:uncharacterized protein LOC134683920 [Mytilus trossulus]|uniref:uncharacterized protein LOC134683920 n=1 Tax=Mytilus trossulus TaxID=6551 RepID=UPI0030079D6A